MTTNGVPQTGTPQTAEIERSSGYINIINYIRFSYEWRITNFDRSLDIDGNVSSLFSNETNREIQWRFKIERINGDRCSVKLMFTSCTVNSIETKCKFQFLRFDNKGQQRNIKSEDKSLEFKVEEYLDCFNIYRGEFDFNDTKLVITCEINVQGMSTLINIPKCTLQNDLDLLLKNQQFSDVTLCASGKEYPVHKAILAARSPVFNAMFEHEMKEKNSNRVDLTDIDGEVLEELLRFIYTGQVSNLENLASDLLPAAEKYGFEKLKVLCGESLCANISIENAAEILLLTDIYHLKELKHVAKRYVGRHAKDVCETTGWNSILQSHPNLIAEVLCDLSEHFGQVVTTYMK